MTLQVRKGRPDEWQEILDVSHATFGRDKTFFPHNWPHTYPDKMAAEWFVVCEEAGKIVGTINQTPMTVNICGVRLKAVGIGGVGVLESARLRGAMSAMLKASNAEQREAGTVLGFLGGERVRYRRHGFELAGQTVTATVHPSQFPDADPAPLRRLRVVDAKDILKLHRKAPMFVWRDEDWQRQLLRRQNFVAWGNKSGPLRAYLVTPMETPGSVCELIGDARLLPGLLKSWMKRHKLANAGSTFIPGYGPHVGLARDAAWLQQTPATQVGIYDFGRFLTQVAGPLGERFRQFGVTDVIRVAHTGEKTAFDLELKRNGSLAVTLATGKRKPRLSFDAAEWIRTFFPPPGGTMLKSKPGARLAAAFALPLNFGVWDSV